MKKILFTGGGSAGHVIPNLALIEELLSEGADVCYMGTNGIEKALVLPWHIPFYTVDCPKLIRGGGWSAFRNNLSIPFALRKAVQQAKIALKTCKPDLVFSKGGYAALPAVLAAAQLGIPCFAHESDFSAGLTTRLTAKKCQTVFTSFPETAATIPHGAYSGAPLRRSLFAYTKAEARRQLQIPFHAKTLLIFGGGSGSRALNDAVEKHLPTLTKTYTVLHVCGKGNERQIDMKNYKQFPFVADMGRLYTCADVVVSRSGAGAAFELLALKKRTIFVPLEGQTRGDQWENALYFQRKGLCRILPQKKLSALPKTVDEVAADQALQACLDKSEFSAGNARILRAMKEALGQ